MNAWYQPGEHAVAIGRRAVVMASVDRAADLAGLLDRPPTALGVLSVLSGGDVANLSDFAAVVADGDDLVVLVRGSYGVAVGDQEWAGEGVATWGEHRVRTTAAREVVVRALDATGDLRLPVATGVVLAAQVSWLPLSDADAAPTTTSATPAAPEPVLEPAPASVPPMAPESTITEADDDFDESVGATIQGHRGPEVPPLAPGAPAADPPGASPGDHDGRTITAEQLRRLRAQQASQPTRPARITATVAMSGGEKVSLEKPVVIGRAPRAAELSSAELPHLIVVDDPYVSSTHVEVALDGESVIAIDRSTNGTVLTRPGGQRERLTKDEPTVLVDGCVLGLSEDVTAKVEIEGNDR